MNYIYDYDLSAKLKPIESRPLRKFETESLRLDEDNVVILTNNILSEEELEKYIDEASQIARTRGTSAYQKLEPRHKVCYTIDGTPFKYSRTLHETKKYPQYILDLLPTFLNIAKEELSKFGETIDITDYKLSHGIDIVYSNVYPGSGSIGAHSDDTLHWPLIIVFSLGQTRYFRIRNKDTKEFTNVEIAHNSMLVMYGDSFQKMYTHQIDRLKPKDEEHYRHSLNIRFVKI